MPYISPIILARVPFPLPGDPRMTILVSAHAPVGIPKGDNKSDYHGFTMFNDYYFKRA